MSILDIDVTFSLYLVPSKAYPSASGRRFRFGENRFGRMGWWYVLEVAIIGSIVKKDKFRGRPPAFVAEQPLVPISLQPMTSCSCANKESLGILKYLYLPYDFALDWISG